MQLRTLKLYDTVVCPEFMAQLAQHTSLEELNLQVAPESVDPDVAVVDCLEIEAITPLPKLRSITINVSSLGNPSHETTFNTPAARYLVSAGAKLARDMPSGKIILGLAPVRTVDVAQCLFYSGRVLSDVDIELMTHEFNSEVIEISFKAGAVNLPPAKQDEFILSTSINWIELSDVAEIILKRFPLKNDIKTLGCDKTVLELIKVLIERDPDVAGLHYLLRRTNANAVRSEQQYFTVF